MKTETLSPLHKSIVDSLFGGSARQADSVAVEGVIFNLQNPESMTKDVYLRLQRLNEAMEMSIAKGKDCINEFDERLQEIDQLIAAAPWTLCPDDGCIPKVGEPKNAFVPRM